jgi:membrane protease subunit HflC
MASARLVALAIAVAVLTLWSAAFVVDEKEHAIVLQFGEFKRTVSSPGLNFKVPLTQQVVFLEKRILSSDEPQAEYLTADKKRLVADPVTRWRVADPLLFFKSLRDEERARTQLDPIVLSELRQELANRSMGDMVGSERQSMMQNVTERVRAKVREFGIEVVDVQIMRLDLPKEVQRSVFDRMVAERERLAKGYRAQGQEESDKITASTDKEQEIILAEANRRAEQLRGEGDAHAAKTYAEAYGKDPEFYAFLRNLETYEKSVDEHATVVMSTGSELFRYLSEPGRGEKK